MRPAGFGAVIQHHLDRILGLGADNPGVRHIGKPVAVGTRQDVFGRNRILVGVTHPLVTYTSAELAYLRQIAAIRSESGDIVLFHSGFRCRNIDPINRIIVRPAGESLLRTCLQLALPDRIRQHRLGGIHAPGIGAAALDGGIVRHIARFHGNGHGTVIRAIIVQIDVYA